MAGPRPTETDRMVAILRKINREGGPTIPLIEHVMRAVMALATRVLVLDHGTAIAEGTRNDRARSRGDAVLSRRRGWRDAGRRKSRRVLRRRAGARCGFARRRGRRHRRDRRCQRRRQDLADPHLAGMLRPARGRVVFPRRDIAGWPSHRVCDLGIGQVAEGRQVFPADGRARISTWAPCCRARAPCAQTASACLRCFRCWPSGRGSPPARCRAASSRCSRSGVA